MIKITIENEKYPDKLKNIKNPPKQLYLEGNIELLHENTISIIGARNCTSNGRILAEKFASELSEQGLVIASGMAKGIDTSAHKGAIKTIGRTIAVLGNGFHHIFPKENEDLYQEIIKNNGLIISEYPPETRPNSNLFLERNRIVSGLSIGILVIEAAYRSGTSVTAKYAKEQGRKVFVLPHGIEETYGIGTNQLIRKGATLITSTKEIIEEFGFLKYKKIPKKKEKTKENKQKMKNKSYQEIYEIIANGNSNINEIYEKSSKTINEVNNIIFMLEIEGYITKKAGGYTCV